MEEKGTSKSATDTTTTTSHGKEKTMIITGGNCGLGFDCAKSFLAGDWGDEWHVIIACRDATRAQEAVALLKKETGNNSIEEMPLDLASLASVRNFVRLLSERKDELPPIRAAVFNAGLQVVSGTKYTEDGFETTFGVNHLGHFLLANLLLKLIKAPARLVFVSSGTHDPKKKTGMPDPEFTSARALAFPDKSEDEAGEEKKGSSSSSDKGDVWIGRLRYTTSKLCNVFCAYEMARRLAPDEDDKDKDEPIISVTAFDPGLMPGTGQYPKSFIVYLAGVIYSLASSSWCRTCSRLQRSDAIRLALHPPDPALLRQERKHAVCIRLRAGSVGCRSQTGRSDREILRRVERDSFLRGVLRR
jgi:NAD(P)-dependent dehydrogenase (short-subunit alcohol dehydrogenase family)